MGCDEHNNETWNQLVNTPQLYSGMRNNLIGRAYSGFSWEAPA